MVDVTRGRRLGLACVVVGVLAIAIAQRASPLSAPPLYDGVIVIEPYRWLVPPPGAKGDPKSASATASVDHGASPLIAIATPEQPPQAQVFAIEGSLVMPPGTTSVKASITPVLPQTLPADGHIAGNVYRIDVTNQAGVPLTAPADAKVSVVMRGPANAADATIERFAGQSWQRLKTSAAGLGPTYLAVVTGFGDFALVVPGAGGPYPTATPAPGAAGSPASSSAGSTETQASAVPGAMSSSAAAPGGSSTPTGASSDNGGGPAVALVVGILVVAAIGAGAVVTRRRRRTPYRGAHRTRR
jgi:hypothetical protein